MDYVRTLDFRNSYAIYSAAKAKDEVGINTCRIQLLAKCTLIDKSSEQSSDFYLGKECIGENVHLGHGIVQEPTCEACIIFCEGQHTALIKKFADNANDVVQIGQMGQKYRVFDGTYSYWTNMRFILRYAEARPLITPQDIITTTLDCAPLVGRTTFVQSEKNWCTFLEYPIPYINVHPPVQGFQVDVGPILLPDIACDVNVKPLVAHLDLAYIMFNNLNKAEFAVRVPTLIGEGEIASTLHYSRVLCIDVENELFSLGE